MEIQLFKDPTVKPENKILEEILGKNYLQYKEFVEKITTKNILLEWNYYNDGKPWLCKVWT